MVADRVKAYAREWPAGMRGFVVAGAYCALLALSFVFGYMTPEGGALSFPRAAVYGLVYFALFFAIALLAVPVVMRHEREARIELPHEERARVRKARLIVFLIMAAAWFVVLLMYWPGSASSDSMNSVAYSVGALPWSDHYPVLYSLLVGLFMHAGLALGNIEWGFALYALFQIVFMAACCSYVCSWILQRSGSLLAFVAAAAFFVLNPVVARYAITMWKDVLFGAFVMLLVVFLADVLYDRERLKRRSTYLKLALLLFLVIMSRGNGMYVVLPTLILLIVLMRKCACWKKIALAGFSTIALCLVIQGPIYDACGVAPNEFRQSVGLPLQQIARVTVDDGYIPDDAREFLEQFMSLERTKEVYERHVVDNVKTQEGFDDEFLNTHKLEFLAAYLSIGAHNFKSYFFGWCDLTLGFWYSGVSNWVCNVRGYYPLDVPSWPVPWPEDANPEGTNLIEDATGLSFLGVADDDYIQLRSISPFGFLFNIATMAWIAFGAVCYKLIRRDYRSALALSPLVFLWVTMLIATPVYCEFRYVYALHLSLPLVAAIVLLRPGDAAGKRK